MNGLYVKHINRRSKRMAQCEEHWVLSQGRKLEDYER
jgi:hypothetical protein